MTWDGLTPPYRTIVADPPWHYIGFYPSNGSGREWNPVPYSTMTVDEIAALPVKDLADKDAHLYLWTTSRYLNQAFDVLRSWGFKYGQTLLWCKPPRGIIGGATFTVRSEFVLFASRGSPGRAGRVDRNWWEWPAGNHSVKPQAFLDIVEQISHGPYVELFARAPRFGWDSWGKGYEVAS